MCQQHLLASINKRKVNTMKRISLESKKISNLNCLVKTR